jgi:hypothetical protein
VRAAGHAANTIREGAMSYAGAHDCFSADGGESNSRALFSAHIALRARKAATELIYIKQAPSTFDLKSLSRRTQMVRAGCILVACLLWVSSAEAEQWQKLGATPGAVARDTDQCKKEAAEKVPPRMAPAYPEPAPGGNQLMARRPEPSSTPAPVTDFNRPARDRYFRACMVGRGYHS